MSSYQIEYHTHNFTRRLIYSDWSLFGIKASFVKVLLNIIIFLFFYLLQSLLYLFTSIVPFLFFFPAIVITSFISGSFAGLLVTALSTIIVIFQFSHHQLTSITSVLLIIFVLQGIGISVLIEIFLRILRRLRRQADLLSLSTEAIVVRDLKTNTLLFWNEGAAKMYGFTKDEVLGKEMHLLLQVKSSQPMTKIEEEFFLNGYWSGELIHTTRSGKQIIVTSEWYLKTNDKDKPAVIVEIINDITKRKALERRKDEFLSIASHELKTPVTSIKAFAQILESRFKKIGDKTSELYLSKMNTQLNRLTNLVNDLLDSTRIQAGKLELNIEPFRVTDLVDEVIENMQITSFKHKIFKKGTSREMVWADRDRTEQVLINLISNAIKYSPRSDKVIVHIVEQQDKIVVGVEDLGIGIPKNKISKIFDRFYRVDSKEGEFTGLGLGLYISAEIIKRQRGHMWVESSEKIGSIFYFSLPIEKENL
jgi:PAS domain S-box-containing protein